VVRLADIALSNQLVQVDGTVNQGTIGEENVVILNK
jgi:hypothetical protein